MARPRQAWDSEKSLRAQVQGYNILKETHKDTSGSNESQSNLETLTLVEDSNYSRHNLPTILANASGS